MAKRRREVRMLIKKTRVLLILPQESLDHARALAGRATATFKLPVSLQIVLRALVEEGLRRDHDPALLTNIEGQAKAVRHLRSLVHQTRRLEKERENPASASRRRGRGRGGPRRRK
jgi:hypothetical protein